jgi:hypothetical protein
VPKKKIKDDDNDMAHIDWEADQPKVIHFIKSSKGSEFMVDKYLN